MARYLYLGVIYKFPGYPQLNSMHEAPTTKGLWSIKCAQPYP